MCCNNEEEEEEKTGGYSPPVLIWFPHSDTTEKSVDSMTKWNGESIKTPPGSITLTRQNVFQLTFAAVFVVPFEWHRPKRKKKSELNP